MNPVVAVLAAGGTAALALALLSLRRTSRASGAIGPLDPKAGESWLVRRVPQRLGPVVRTLDRRVVGGAALVFSLIVVFLSALVVGAVLDMVDEDRGLARWDAAAAEWGAANATPTSTDILHVVTDLGGTWILLAVVAAVATVDVVRNRNRDVVLHLVTVLGGIVLVNNLLKLVVDRDRPDIAQLAGWSGASFPSGHSAAAAATWAAVAYVATRHASRPVRAVAASTAVALAIAVAASRVLLGVHWLTDVVAGVVVGWGWFFLVTLAFGGRVERLGEPAERVASRPLPTDHATIHTPIPTNSFEDAR